MEWLEQHVEINLKYLNIHFNSQFEEYNFDFSMELSKTNVFRWSYLDNRYFKQADNDI